MSDLTVDQKQNRLTNILLVGNLYKSHQISKSINSLVGGQKQLLIQNREQHQQTMGVLKSTESIVKSQLQILTQGEKKKHLKNLFFEINEELEELTKNQKYTNVEKFCKLSTLKNLLENKGIDHSITDDLEEKKYIKESIKNLEKENENIKNNLSQKDKEDLEEIYEVISNDEEFEIYQLKQDNDYVIGQISLKLKDYYQKLMKCHNGVGLLGFMEADSKLSITIQRHNTNKETLKWGGAQCPIFGSQRRNEQGNVEDFFMLRLGIPALSLIFLNPQSDKDISDFRYNFFTISEEKKYRSERLIVRWIKERLRIIEFYKEIGFLESGLYANAATDFYKIINDGDKAEFGFSFLKKTRGNSIDEVFADTVKRYGKVITHLNKYAESAFMNAFPEEEEKFKLVEKKIKKLEERIDLEKEKVSLLVKKHPFVGRFFSNRLEDSSII